MDFFEQLKDFLEEHKKLMLALAVLATIGGSLLIPDLCSLLSSQTEFSMDSQSKSALSSFSANWSNASTISASNSVNSDYIYVDVKGAIKHPGVYKVQIGKRVGDVLSLAGGPLEGADTTQINFAHKLEDQMVIYIPKVGESSPIENTVGVSGSDDKSDQNEANSAAEKISSAQTQTDSTSQDQGGNDGKINLNTASKEQLMQLTGIGDKKADEIIAYRQQNGNFKTIDDLKNVSGIGDKTFEKISSQITV